LETGSGAVFGYFGHALPGDKMTGLMSLDDVERTFANRSKITSIFVEIGVDTFIA